MKTDKKHKCSKCGQPKKEYIFLSGLKIYILMMFSSLLVFFALTIMYPINIMNFISAPTFHLYSQFSLSDPVVVNITNYCNFNMTSKEQVECVVAQVSGFYDYSFDNRSFYIVKSPSMVVESGGLCRDVAVLYDSVFTNLGYKTSYSFTETHVFNIIYKDNSDFTYCVVDQYTFECVGGE